MSAPGPGPTDAGSGGAEAVSAVKVERRDSARGHWYHFSLALRPVPVEAP